MPPGNDRRLESSHLRCTGLPAAIGLCLPQVQSRRRRAKKRWKTVKGVRHESGGGAGAKDGEADAECLFLPLFCGQKPHCGWDFALAARLLSIFGCLYFDSRFTVLAFSLAFSPLTLNNMTARSVKPLWCSVRRSDMYSNICDIQPPFPLFVLPVGAGWPSKSLSFLLYKAEKIFTKTRKT